MSETRDCACVHHDAYECARVRDVRFTEYDDYHKRACECCCHKDEDYDDDNPTPPRKERMKPELIAECRKCLKAVGHLPQLSNYEIESLLTLLDESEKVKRVYEKVSERCHRFKMQLIELKAAISDVVALRTENTELKRDRERLDWMDKNRTNHIYQAFKYHASLAATRQTWRAAIDAARADGKDGVK